MSQGVCPPPNPLMEIRFITNVQLDLRYASRNSGICAGVGN